ncbi:MAG: thioredoxin domain-containing protein [Candidatus Eremiobacteraeota bacterium]|nr:thioredoxin domain-containing protein [Candidatus Eremiobacteraeota bacterium]MBC5821924.1 thioredoxin domain-containing protein [Candidatus Eremiobacteraeota bacterium]
MGLNAPGAAPFSDEVRLRIAAALANRPRGETPRTRHRDGDVAHFTNRLILETSPYLRQHAHNPVNWYPWGDEAFDEARRRGIAVFLSVGYSTCHWCHVMEEESFEDVEIARFLNEHYVAIKVDREERPDVDTVYMTAVTALSGHGGWPMSVWLDAERRPFFAATYLPARDGERGARRGFLAIAQQLAELYRADPQRVAEAAQSITAAIGAAMTRTGGTAAADALPGTDVLDAAAHFYERAHDSVNGGIRGAPKFPSSMPVRLLLRHHHRTGDTASLQMAEHALEMMAAGGMHDQLSGGFHRYSTDERWLIPHFEKMLYDNALLAVAYAEAWQVTKRADFGRILRTTLDYVVREMTSPEGGFFSATDADSEGEEGAFFVWSTDQIRERLGAQAEPFMRFYGVTARGNFEGKNVLFVPRPDEDQWEALGAARETLRIARERRPHPLRDDKVLTAWNGLMISAMAVGGRVLAEPRYVAAATRAADFVLTQLRRDERLQRSWKEGRSSGPGFLEDDAFFVAALLDLYEATFDHRRLAQALHLAERTERLFGDAEHGGWFRSATDHEKLIAREKPNYDGAEPSGASVALLNALRLHTITGDDRPRRSAERALHAYAPTLRAQPGALHDMLLALDYFIAAPREIVLVWRAGEGPPAAFVDPLRREFLPNRALLGAAEGADFDALAQLAPLTTGKVTLSGRPTAYVCERGACRLPTIDPVVMEAQIAGASAQG